MFAFAGILILSGLVSILVVAFLTGLPAEPIVLGFLPQWMFWSIAVWFVYLGIFLHWAWKMNKFFAGRAPDSLSAGNPGEGPD